MAGSRATGGSESRKPGRLLTTLHPQSRELPTMSCGSTLRQTSRPEAGGGRVIRLQRALPPLFFLEGELFRAE